MRPADIAGLIEDLANEAHHHGPGHQWASPTALVPWRECINTVCIEARAAAASLREHGACNGDCQYARELRNRKTVEEMSWDELRELEAKENPPAPPAEPVATCIGYTCARCSGTGLVEPEPEHGDRICHACDGCGHDEHECHVAAPPPPVDVAAWLEARAAESRQTEADLSLPATVREMAMDTAECLESAAAAFRREHGGE